MKSPIALAALTTVLSYSSTFAEDWYPSEFGAEDTLGAVNRMSPAAVVEAAKLVKTGKTYALGIETGPDTPAYGPRKYQMTILQLDDGTGTRLGDNKLTSNDDLMMTWLGIGSQIDGLGHVGIDHLYYNGVPAKDFTKVTGVTKFSISDVPPIVSRGVLLDIARLKGQPMLEAGTAINQPEIEAAAKTQGIEIRKGDVVLFNTGWLSVAAEDGEKFMKGEPGLGMGGAQYLADIGVIAVGADTYGLEVIPFETKGQVFPVHQELITKKGIYLLENIDTRALAKDEGWEFLFVLGQPRFLGAVQAVINPVAIR